MIEKYKDIVLPDRLKVCSMDTKAAKRELKKIKVRRDELYDMEFYQLSREWYEFTKLNETIAYIKEDIASRKYIGKPSWRRV